MTNTKNYRTVRLLIVCCQLDFIDKKKAEREAKKHFEKSEVTDFEYN